MTEYQYVPHDLIQKFLADGWEVAHDLSDCHHGAYAVLMRRECDEVEGTE